MVELYLTVRFCNRAETRVGHIDRALRSICCAAQKIKGTPGITGLPLFRVPIDGVIWHLDVGLSYPGAESGSKGLAVRQLKRYMSWVQNVVKQFGPYLL